MPPNPRFADGSRREKTRHPAEPSAHEDDLRLVAHRLMDAAGLHYGRLAGLVHKSKDSVDVEEVAAQIGLDNAREAHLVAETAVDRVREKFGAAVMVQRPSSVTLPDPTD
ncbi:hypothetical protein [Streptomyces sp. CdTB01]|uniref:hypothetical protein n=1 Tax=Streptomyces sp. CdTB01 TaxID=1725411 RepID=UPI00073A6894|nr:hypothetical protein [Streptomyces sp. CdTB01]ALV31028.1 hypothetical protein AS200_02240 [Streptomyces sp. CdTB01]